MTEVSNIFSSSALSADERTRLTPETQNRVRMLPTWGIRHELSVLLHEAGEEENRDPLDHMTTNEKKAFRLGFNARVLENTIRTAKENHMSGTRLTRTMRVLLATENRINSMLSHNNTQYGALITYNQRIDQGMQFAAEHQLFLPTLPQSNLPKIPTS